MDQARLTRIVKEDCESVVRECRTEFENLAGKTILITGSTGFVGRSLLESVLRYNETTKGERCHLILPVRNASKLASILDGRTKDIDIANWADDGSLDIDLEFEVVVHAASPSDPASYLTDPFTLASETINLTESVVRLAKRSEVEKILYISSGAVYGPQPEDMPAIGEDYLGAPDVTLPLSCYGEAKRCSEALCLHSGIPSVCARLFSFIGPYQDLGSSFAVPDFINNGLQGKDIIIRGDGSPIRGYCYVSDLCIALWKLLVGETRYPVYNVGSDRFQIDIEHLARLVADSFGGIDVRVLGRSGSGTARPNVKRYVPDITRLRPIYEPRIDIKEGIRRTIAHHLESRSMH